MPIIPALHIRNITNDDFSIIDRMVMRQSYSVQNKFGKLFDERVYENDLAARLKAEGLDVETQVPILVTHSCFQKTYFVDLIVNHMPYELKVVAGLNGEHDAQCLHYAMLQDISLIKLINFGEQKVRGKLLRNSLNASDRHQPKFASPGMRAVTQNCERLLSHFTALVNDWGTHLSCHLYNEALVYFFGGEEYCVLRMEVKNGSLLLGTHRVQCHAEGIAFVVTSLSRGQAAFEKHLNVLLTHTDLRVFQWFNLNRSEIEISTICKDGKSMQLV